MTPATTKLAVSLIRLARGMLSAAEEWVRAQQEPPKLDPDPIKHFEQYTTRENTRAKSET